MPRPAYAGLLLACGAFLAVMGGVFLYTGIRAVGALVNASPVGG
jgi:hypothetical protein